MLFKKVLPRSCSLMTWEYSANYEESPTEARMREKISRELPLLWNRGLAEKMIIWPLISFNSQEGRLFRYLLIILQDHPAEKDNHVYLPAQLGLVSEADQLMKSSKNFTLSEHSQNEGNYFFWSLHRGILYILVFFEGRLCHWSEEHDFDDVDQECLEGRLQRFRKFLKEDSLFSRAENFIEQEIIFPEKDSAFYKASKDPFFRKLNLNIRQNNSRGKKFLFRKFFVFSVVLFALLFYFKKECLDIDEIEIPDVEPVSLLDPPQESLEGEFREESVKDVVPDSVTDETPCLSPSLKIKGLVGGQFALMDCSEKCFKEILSPGDSVGNFVVQTVGRDRLVLSCRDKIVEVLAR